MGGWIAFLMARARPARVAGIVGIAPAVDFTEELIWKRLPPEPRRAIEEDGVWFRPSDYGPEPYPITRRLTRGRASCRERVLPYVEIPAGAGDLKNNTIKSN